MAIFQKSKGHHMATFMVSLIINIECKNRTGVARNQNIINLFVSSLVLSGPRIDSYVDCRLRICRVWRGRGRSPNLSWKL